MEASQLEAQFATHLTRMVPEGSLVAAVSGGGDSVALLLLLTSTPRKVVVAHLDHSLRPESAQDALWVKALAERLGYPFESERLDVAKIAAERGENLEATARELRYGFLAKVAKKHQAQAILTAHTEDDQAETVLLQLVQGTGRGLGMRPKRGKVVRPLLELSRSTLRAYLRCKQQDWLEDVSNADTSLDRNFLRHEIFPRLKARFPQTQTALARFAAISQLDDEALDPLAEQLHSCCATGAGPARPTASRRCSRPRRVCAGGLCGRSSSTSSCAPRWAGWCSSSGPYRAKPLPSPKAGRCAGAMAPCF